MRARLATLLAAVTLVACEPPAASPARPASNTSAPPIEGREDLPEEQRSSDLYGAWLVETISLPDGTRPDKYHDMILLAGARQLELLSQCVAIGPFGYGRTSGGGVVVDEPAPVRSPSPNRPPSPTPVQCARMLSPAEQAVPAVLFAARKLVRNPDGSLTLSGGAGSLVLRRPTGALGNPRGEAPRPTRPPLIGAWRFDAVNGRKPSQADRMELLLRPRTVEWRSGCVNDVRPLSVDRDRLVPGPVEPYPICERGRSQMEVDIERLFSEPLVGRMGADGRLTLTGSGTTAELTPLTR